MASPITEALAALVQSALPWHRWLNDTPRPPHTVEEALEADVSEGIVVPEPIQP